MHNERQQVNPMDVLNGIAVMQAMTLGFVVTSQFLLNRNIRRLITKVPVKEVVVVYRDVKEVMEEQG